MDEEQDLSCCGGHCQNHGDDCECDGCSDEESYEEKIDYANDKIDALIRLMIKKGFISEEEIESEYSEVFDEEHVDDDSDKSDYSDSESSENDQSEEKTAGFQ